MIQIKDALSRVSHRVEMNPAFHVAALSDNQVPQAFPLIQATWPGVGFAAWQSFVQFFRRGQASGESGVLGLHDPAQSICGILAYHLDRDLRMGLTLAVPLFTAVDLANSRRSVRALLDAAELRAGELGCTGIQIRLYYDQARVASRLRALGLSSESIGLFWKESGHAPIAH